MQSGILPRDKMEGSAALFVTSWKKTSYSPANWKLITDICENTLKKKSELSAIYCTVLDVELSEEQREDATQHGVTLIPSTRPKWSKPDEDPPVINWLLNHYNYYPVLAKLEDITHVIGLYAKTHNAASEIHESLFQEANLHLVPSKPAALFVGNSWSKDELGLTGFHRTLVQDFCERKAKAGEDLIAYSTVLDVKINDDQKKDAENCGVTLIPAQRKEKADHRDDPPKLEWLLNHEIYYPDLQKLENVQYVIGYAPKTGRAAADIRRKLFPGAKLVFINHACPERNYLQAEEYSPSEFEEKMLQMASEADILFSIGPYIFDYFENAYRAEFQGRDLSNIPHEEILPRPDRCFWERDPKLRPVARHHILTYGQMDTQMAIEGCKSIAVSIGTAANLRKAHCRSHPDWKIQGVSKKAGKIEQKVLADASKSPHVYPNLQPGHSSKSLLTSLQQSHLCLPSPYYVDYSFHGLEAMAFGLPTSVHDDSHLAHFVMKHLELHVDNCVVRTGRQKLSKKISQHLEKTSMAFKKAKALKTAMMNCDAITQSFAIFASLLKEPVKTGNDDDADVSYNHGKSSMQSTKQVSESLNGTMSKLAVSKDDGTGSQAIEETHGDVKDEEDTESGQVMTTPPEKENEKPNTEEAKVRNCNKEHQDFQVKVALDEEMLQKRLRQSEEQTQALSVRPQQNDHEVKAAWGECEQRLKRRVQAVLADEDGCNEVKKVCLEKVGLDPTTVTTESLGILLKILTLYYLYRVKQTCRSRNLAKALEPLLITDEMRKIAATVGITLQLKAMYDMAKFEEIELFFIYRDGGGVQPVTFHDETEDNGGHCNLGSEPASDPIAEPSQTNLEQSLEEKLTQHGDPTLSITAAYSSLSLQARSLLPIKPSKYQLTDSDIRYLALAKSKVQSLQSQLDKAFTEKLILQGRLTDALNEKSQFKMQYDEHMQQFQHAEKVVATQRSEINTLTAQLKEKDKVITGLRTQLEQVSGAQSDIELLKKLAEERQLGETIVISEMDDIDILADNEYIKPKITDIEKEEGSQPKMTSTEGSGMESTATLTQPEMTGSDGSEKEAAVKTEVVTTATEHQTGISNGIAWLEDHLKKLYIEDFNKFQPLPWIDAFYLNGSEVYTRLEFVKVDQRGKEFDRKGLIKSRPTRSESCMVSMNEMFGLSGSDKRIRIEGPPAIGKSMFCSKLAYDWACGNFDQYKLAILLEGRHVQKVYIVDTIFDQLLPDDANISKEELAKFLSCNEDSILFIFDGLDEIDNSLKADNELDLNRIIVRKRLSKCTVVITSRPHECYKQLRGCDSHFNIYGFAAEDRDKYMLKFFEQDKKAVKKLKQCISNLYIDDHNQESFLRNPLNYLLVCFLWEHQLDDESFLTKKTDLYTKILESILHRYCSKNDIDIGPDNSMDLVKGEVPSDIRTAVDALAEIAYNTMREGKTLIMESDIKPECLLSLGLLVCDIGISRLRPKKVCYFSHKSWLEYFTARFVAASDDPIKYMEYMFNDIESYRTVFTFVVGMLKANAGPLFEYFGKVMNTFLETKDIDVTVVKFYMTLWFTLLSESNNCVQYLHCMEPVISKLSNVILTKNRPTDDYHSLFACRNPLFSKRYILCLHYNDEHTASSIFETIADILKYRPRKQGEKESDMFLLLTPENVDESVPERLACELKKHSLSFKYDIFNVGHV